MQTMIRQHIGLVKVVYYTVSNGIYSCKCNKYGSLIDPN